MYIFDGENKLAIPRSKHKCRCHMINNKITNPLPPTFFLLSPLYPFNRWVDTMYADIANWQPPFDGIVCELNKYGAHSQNRQTRCAGYESSPSKSLVDAGQIGSHQNRYIIVRTGRWRAPAHWGRKGNEAHCIRRYYITCGMAGSLEVLLVPRQCANGVLYPFESY